MECALLWLSILLSLWLAHSAHRRCLWLPRTCSWPAGINYFIVALLPIGILALATWISVYRRQSKTSDASITLRIMLGYLQLLGVLGAFLAKGERSWQACQARWFKANSTA